MKIAVVSRSWLSLTALWLFGLPLWLSAAEPKVPTPSGFDFENQGEYSGNVTATDMGNSDVGVQVIATGDGKFTAAGHTGGLPGDGWDHSPRYVDKSGLLADGVVEFKGGQGFSSTLKDGVLTILLAGVEIGKLKKQDRQSPTLGAPPPPGAIVLFDGSSADNFEKGKIDEDNLLLPGCISKEKFGSGRWHIEFRVPFMPKAEGQARGNSGVYLQGRYEIQILDSFGLEESDNGCGAIYGVKAPEQNMSYPPGAWQTYDIDFTAAKFDADEVKLDDGDAKVTVKHNGVAIHRRAKLQQVSPSSKLSESPQPGPLYLQNHRDPVRFQNIWFLPAADPGAGRTIKP